MDAPVEELLKEEPKETANELDITIGLKDGFVFIDFGRPVKGIIFTKRDAKNLASKLIKAGMK